ncbi:MAG: hypothetical protein U0457_18945 [Candidatus Sericytochromatia bacterium]
MKKTLKLLFPMCLTLLLSSCITEKCHFGARYCPISDNDFWENNNIKTPINYDCNKSCLKDIGKSLYDINNNSNDFSTLVFWQNIGDQNNKKTNYSDQSIYINKLDSDGKNLETLKNYTDKYSKDNYQFITLKNSNYYFFNNINNVPYIEKIDLSDKLEKINLPETKEVISFTKYFYSLDGDNNLNIYRIKDKNNKFFIDFIKYSFENNSFELKKEINTGIPSLNLEPQNISFNKITENTYEASIYFNNIEIQNDYSKTKKILNSLIYYSSSININENEQNKTSSFSKIFDRSYLEGNKILLLNNLDFIFLEENKPSYKEKIIDIEKFSKEGKSISPKINLNPSEKNENTIINYKLVENKSLKKYFFFYEYTIENSKILNTKDEQNKIVPFYISINEHKIKAKILDENFKEEKIIAF